MKRQPSNRGAAFLANPWGITEAEAQVLVRIPDMSSDQIGAEIGRSIHTVQSHIISIYQKMNAQRSESACIYWDRWWQNWQHANPQSALEARDQLGL